MTIDKQRGRATGSESPSLPYRARRFAQARAKVTVGLTDGDVRPGFLESFDPRAAHLELFLTAGPGAGDAPALTLSVRQLTYVAFHRQAQPEPVRVGGAKLCEVHLPGLRSVTVEVPVAQLGDSLGFFGYPPSRSSLYSELFFFREGVLAVEDKETVGAMLVKQSLVDREALDKGLRQLEENRSQPIGEILVEQARIPRRAVDGAVAEQALQRRRGRPARIGEILVDAGLATEAQIEAALEVQKKKRGKRLGEVLVEMGFVNEEDVAQVLARKFHLPYVDLDHMEIDPAALAQVPVELVSRSRILPVSLSDDELTIAISDPLALEAIDMFRFSSPKRIREVVVTPTQLSRYLEPFLTTVAGERTGDMRGILQDIEQEGPSTSSVFGSAAEYTPGEAESGVARLVNRIIIDAYQRGASDIHIEPNGARKDVQVRFRVDGVCEPYHQLPAAYRQYLVSRIKIMANLDMTERRKPQDGKMALRVDRQRIELRVATLPTASGDEDAVLRILPAGGALPLSGLDLAERNLAEIERVLTRSYGLILAVGPTGSGKTTTLHAMLGRIDPVARKIWTAEDPVEITQQHLRQVQMNPRIGLTFATALRAFLRADPDVIMVGEMRDLETATIGVQASLTGHLVLSTLHTNSAPETVTRLVDMGLDPFLFSDALVAVLGQRLGRRLCTSCREEYEPGAAERAELEHSFGQEAIARLTGGRALRLFRGRGCARCRKTRYKGRIALHELLVNNDEVRHAIQRRAPLAEVRALAASQGMTTLAEDGLAKCLAGLTDPRQVLGVAG